MKYLAFFIIFISSTLYAQRQLPQSAKLISGYDPRRDHISDKYVAGEFLIYDCVDKHWVCVMEEYFEDCRDKREMDKRLKKSHAQCAPIAQFDVKFSCFQEQLRLVGNVEPQKLCVLEEWKNKAVSFE